MAPHPSLPPLTVPSSVDTASSRCTPTAPSLPMAPAWGLATSPSSDGQQLPIPPTLPALHGTTWCRPLALPSTAF